MKFFFFFKNLKILAKIFKNSKFVNPENLENAFFQNIYQKIINSKS